MLCSVCGLQNLDGGRRCKSCISIISKYQRIKRQFNLESDEYELLKKEQGNSCAICGYVVKEGGRSLNIDHDHSSGLVRGLLCHICNRLLSFARDNPDVLEAASSYLRHPPVTRILGKQVFGLKGSVAKKRRVKRTVKKRTKSRKK